MLDSIGASAAKSPAAICAGSSPGAPPPDYTREPHTTPTVTIVLHGALAKRFGRRHQLGVETAAQAAYALCSLHPDFREAFQDGAYRVIRGSVAKGLPLSVNMLGMKIGRAGEIHFLPAARGAKGGAGKIIVGALIIVAAIVLAVPSGGTSIAAAAAALGSIGITAGGLALFGASILLAGISAAISPQPKNNSSVTDQRASFGLTGNMNSTQEGSVVPVVYGRQRVGSVVGSFGYSAQDYDPNANPVLTPLPSDQGGGTTSSGAVGSGGSAKGGGSGGASELPNTLRSNAVVRVIDLLSEGPIGGLVDGAKSIFFNGTPLMASDGSYNFQGVTWQEVLGYPDQQPVPGYPAAEQTLSGELGLPQQVKQLLPKIVTVNSPTATAVRMTIHIPTYMSQDPKTGDLTNGPDLRFKFEIRRTGGDWQQVASDYLHGQKCVTSYQRSYRVQLPGALDAQRATSWDIRMTRTSLDDVDSSTQSQTWFDEVTMITEHLLSYSNTAYIALTIDAASFGGQIPVREYEIDGMVCQVPLNYDPVGHTYATTGPGTAFGSWDGASWKPAVTSNPCWCLYDMLSSSRYGMGLPAAVLAGTRYDLFPISQYCDQRVPSGFNDQSGHPLAELRYSLNVSMTTQDDAYRVIQSMSSSFRGMSYWGAGRVVVGADMPTQPSSVMNQTTVINGEFSYEGTSLKTRHTVARVAWQDPTNSYKVAIETVEDFPAVVVYGQFPVDLHAFGCTSRGLARRLGKWLLDTEKTQNETMTTKVGPAHLRVRPGDVVLVTDPAFVGQVMGGRTAPDSLIDKVYLDRILDAPPDLYYTLSVNLPDGTVETRNVSSITVYPGGNNGNSIVSMLQAFSQPPDVHAAWVLSSAGTTGPHDAAGTRPVIPRQFRILGVTEPSRGVFQVVGVNEDPNKFARVEYGIQFDPAPYSVLGELLATPLPPPTNVGARDYITGVGSTTLVRATVSCNPANDPRVSGQQFRAAGPEQRIEGGTGASFDFDGLALGTYVFSVRSVGRDGRASVWVDSDPVLVDGLADPPTAVTGFTATGGAMSVDLSFNASTARDLLHYELWRAGAPNNGVHPFPLTSFVPTGTPGQNGATLLSAFHGTRYHDAGDVLGPDKAWAYWLRPVNTTLVAGAFVGPVRALTTDFITDDLAAGIRNTAAYAQALLGSAPVVVNDLNTPGAYDGQLALLTTDGKLYKWDATHEKWVLYIALVPDSTGKLSADQVTAINNVQIQGNLTPEQTAALIAGLSAGQITSDKIATLVGSKVTGLLSNATMQAGQIYDVDPVTGQSVVGINTAKLLGPLSATKIFDVDSAGNIIPGITTNRIVGQLPTSQLVGAILAGSGTSLDLGAAGITGNLPTSKLVGDVLAGTQAGLNLASQGITGQLSTAKLTGNILASSNVSLDLGAAGITGNMPTSRLVGDILAGLGAALNLGSQNISGQLSTSKLTGNILASATALLNLQSPQVSGVLQAANIAAVGTLNGTILSTQVGPDTILAPMIKAGEINAKLVNAYALNASNIAAGAITAAALAVGSINNAIANSCFAYSADGWGGLQPVPVIGTADEANYGLNGLGAGRFNAGQLAPFGQPGCYVDSYYTASAAGSGRVFDTSIPAVPGEVWEAQATFLPYGGTLEVILIGVDASGGQTLGATTGAQTYSPPANGKLLANWRTIGVKAVIPQGTIAVTMLLRFANPAGVTSTIGGWVTRTQLGRTVANATALLAWTPGGLTSVTGGLIQTNAITARTITAGAVTTVALAAGSITGEKLAISSSSNVIWNTSCVVTADGWQAGGNLPTTLGSGLPGFTLTGEGTGYLQGIGQLTLQQEIYVVWSPTPGVNGTPCGPGAWVEVQALIAAHRCCAFVQVQFLDAGGNLLPGATTNGNRIAGVSGGPLIVNYALSWCKAQAPTGTASVRMAIAGFNDGAGDFAQVSAGFPAGSSPYLFWTRASTGASTPVPMGLSQPQAWAPGGLTSITGGMIQTGTVLARNIGANQVTTAALAAGSVVAGTIAAGAVTAEKLSVGSVNNVIANSCFAYSADGWGGLAAIPVIGTADQAGYGLDGQGSGRFNAGILAAGATSDAWYNAGGAGSGRYYDASVPVVPGEVWEAQATFLPFGGTLEVFLLGTNVAGQATLSVTTGPQTFTPPANGTALSNWRTIGVRATIPAGTACIGLLLRFGNPLSLPATIGSFVTRTLLGKTVPNAAGLLPWTPGGVTSITGGLIQTATIVARNIIAGAITTAALAAGAVTAANLAVSSPSNVIWNASCVITADGWLPVSNIAVTLGSGLGGYTLLGEGTGYLSGIGQLGLNQIIFAAWQPTPGVVGVPCVAGEWVEVQALVGGHRCAVIVQLQFFDANGSILASYNGNRIAGLGGGTTKAFYGLSWTKALAPAGSVTARIAVTGVNDGGGDFFAVGAGAPAGYNPYVFWTRAAIGSSTPVPMAQSQPQVWAPGGLTTITGGMIQTGTVLARNIGANQVTTAALAAGSVIAGTIAAGAITAEKLAVGSVNNAIANSCFAYSGDGWAGLVPVPVIGTGDQNAYSLGGLGAARFNAGVLAAGATADCFYTAGQTGTGRAYDASVPALAGECWEAQATFIPYGGTLEVYILGANSTGALTVAVSTGAQTFNPPADGTVLANWHTIGVRAVIPAGTVTVSILLRFGNPSTGPATIGGWVTRTQLGKTVPNAAALLAWTPGGVTSITGGLLQTNTVVARNIVAGAVTAGKIAAGAVTAETLAISSGTNLVWNPSCMLTTDGWLSGGSIANTLGYGLGGYTLFGEGTGYVLGSGQLGLNQIIYAVWQPAAGVTGVACGPGDWIEVQALVAAHRCSVTVQLQFFDANGSTLSGLASARVAGPAGGTAKTGYALAWAKAQAPAGAATARLAIVGINDGGTDFAGAPAGSNPYVFFTRASIGASTPVPMAQSQPQAWAPGGTTQLSGGMLQTSTILARSIAANQITARELAVGNSANVITNSCFAVSTDGWSVTSAAGGTYGTFGSCASYYTQYATPDGCGVIDQHLPAGAIVDVAWQPAACTPGDTWEGQIKVLPIACTAALYLQWRDGAGNILSSTALSAAVTPSAVPPASANGGLSAFSSLSLIAVAPAGAAQVLLVLRLGSPQASQANGFTIMTRALLGLTVAGATQPSAWAPGGITSISGGVLKTGTVVTRNIAAGAITANTLAVASASNVIWNSTCPSTSAGWILETSCPGTQIGSVSGDGIAPAAYALTGLGTGAVSAASMAIGQTMHAYWDPDSVGGYPAAPGDWWECQALLGAHRCWAQVQMLFFGVGNAALASASGSRVAGPAGGTQVAGYGLSWCKLQAPAGTTRVVFYVCAFNDGAADIGSGTPGVNPYLFFTKAALGPSVPNASQPQPWQPGGVTQVSAGMLKTGSVTARSVAAGSITANAVTVGSVTNVITNACCAVTTFGWSAGVQRWNPGDPWYLAGYGSGYATLGSQATDTWADYFWAPNGSGYKPDGVHAAPYDTAIPCQAGELWESQVLVETHRCSVELFVIFCGADAAGNWNVLSAPSTGAQSFSTPPGGQAETQYTQLAVRGVAPAGATLVTLMMRMGNTATARAVQANVGANPYLMFTKAGLGPALPYVARMPWGPGGRVSIEGGEIRAQSILANSLAVGAVVAGTIAAGAVVAGTIAAGAVTAANLAVGNPNNAVWNGCPDQGSFGWGLHSFGAGMPPPNQGGTYNLGMGAAILLNANFALTGSGSGFSQYVGPGGVYSNQGFYWDWSPTGTTPGIPGVSGGTYGAAALLLAGNGCTAYIQLIFMDYNQAIIGFNQSASVTTGGPNGLIEDYYTRVTLAAVAPSGTAFVLLRIAGSGAAAGASQPYFGFTKAMVGQMEAGAKVGAWTAGGVTTINGNMIKTGSLDASRITAGSITAGQLAAQSVTATQLAANSVSAYNLQAFSITGDRIAANTIVGGNIQAAAIGADQIAGNQIYARHLATDFALVSSAQIGLATIQTANIADLTVNGRKITPGAVSSFSYAANHDVRPIPYSWVTLTSMGVTKTVGGSGVAIFLKSFNDIISFSD